MANITLKVDDRVLEKARRLAMQKKTSINAIIRNKIQEFVSSDSSRESSIKGLDNFFNRSKARVGKRSWTREDLYER
jgi:hypothetical protein